MNKSQAQRREDDEWGEERRTLGGLLTISSRALTGEFHRRLDAIGYGDIRPGSGSVFEHIGDAGSTVAVMAGRAGISPQAMVQLVDYLESQGYVHRLPDPTDRRAKIVRLTERGREADRVSRRILADIEHEWGEIIGESRLRNARKTLEDLMRSLG